MRIYIDADFSHSVSVAQGIELGVRAALQAAGQQDRFDVVARDHRANSRRSFDTVALAASDPHAVAVFGGMHSPPYLTFNQELNAHGIPILLPWSAGAAITRGVQGRRNWMFRVSVDDAMAGAFLADEAMNRNCRRPGMVAVDTPWGTGNLVEVQRQLQARGARAVGAWRLETGAGYSEAARIVQLLENASVDCLLLFGSSYSSINIIQNLALMQRPPTVLSHWGIYGNPNLMDELRVPLARVDLRVLGTCGLERMRADPALVTVAEASATAAAALPVSISAMQPPHAFFNAFDATQILLAALEKAQASPNWTADADDRRNAIRQALYSLPQPVVGLLATYQQPFDPVQPDNPDGHEALGKGDLCMQRIDAIGRLRPGTLPLIQQVDEGHP